ncbi:MAG: proliferating cell nuclear antigen (pcna) [Candidatus Micrarchaeota archaeon]|nr:proliferating cell nuclear antigen (pcna) [Candidatus Micrarchaeota archaeon]MDE1849151.1 proliferating cell nuclear antigen (pcna) [Candidatus Micrarchaeota archaeon]
MFEIKLDNAKYWRDCVASIVSLVDEGLFNVTKEGISLKAMDPSSISMVSFFMPEKAFSKYSVDKSTNVGLNLENLSKILSRTRDNEALVMKDSDNKLSMEFISPSSRRRYKMQMIDVKKSVEKEPNVDFEAHVEISGDQLKEIIKDAGLISSYIAFKATKDQFGVSARGDSGELEALHDKNGDVIKKIEASKPADAVFNLEFMDNMVKSCPIGNSVLIDLKSNEPLRMNYNIGEASISYFLAPYMEE